MYRFFRSTIALTIAAVLTFLSSPAYTDEPVPDLLLEAQKAFSSIGKKSIPAVVSIQVEVNYNNRYNPKGARPQGSHQEFFNDDFWKRFFGVPESNSSQEKQVIGQGSGFLITPDGYILTNNHVIDRADSLSVLLNNGSKYQAKVVGQDPKTDLAVLKIEGEGHPFLTLGDSNEHEIGEWVIAIGNPLGLEGSLTVGVISAKGRNNLNLSGNGGFEDFIQTDAAINRGNSGGPLLNLKGEVIGVNTAIATTSGGYMGIGFAIPTNIAKNVMEQLITSGVVSRGFLGVTLQSIDEDLAEAFGLSKAEGALISDVLQGSPAEISGIRSGDIITHYNGSKVKNITALRNAVSMVQPGTEISLKILRDNKPVEIAVKVGEHPDNRSTSKPTEQVLGLQVEKLSSQLANQFGYREGSGVVITDVKPYSPAAAAGLSKGMLILSVNREVVTTPKEFYSTVNAIKKGKKVLLLVKQGTATHFVSITVE